MNLTLTGLVTESYFKCQPETPGAAAPWRNIIRSRTEFPTADAALTQYLTPVADITYTFDDFPTINLNGQGINNDIGLPAAFAALFLLHLRIAPYRPDLAASGTVGVILTDMFGSGEHACGLCIPGDELIRVSKAGFPLISTSKLELVVNDPVNLAVELMLQGLETGGAY